MTTFEVGFFEGYFQNEMTHASLCIGSDLFVRIRLMSYVCSFVFYPKYFKMNKAGRPCDVFFADSSELRNQPYRASSVFSPPKARQRSSGVESHV